MRKSVKKIGFFLVGFFFLVGVSSANAPVIDITNLLQAIQQGYSMYQQLETMFQQLKNAKEQLEKQKKNFESLSLGELDALDPLGSWSSIMGYADSVASYTENIESVFKSKSMQWGDVSFSYEDLYSTDFYERAITEAWDDPFEKTLSTEEKAEFHSQFGMSYGHYMRYNALANELTQTAGQTKSKLEEMQIKIQEDREHADTIASSGVETESVLTAAKSQAALTELGVQTAITQADILASLYDLEATKVAMEAQELIEEQKLRELYSPQMSPSFGEMWGNDNDFK